MPRGSKKRRNAAKKKQENRPNNQSSSVRSPGNEEDVFNAVENEEDVTQIDEKQREVVRVESEGSNNGGGSTSGSDDDICISSVEEVVTVSPVLEKVPQLVVRVKRESSVEDNGKNPNQVGCNAGKPVERNEERIVRSGNRAEWERDSTVTEPLLVPENKTSWRSCCGLFEVFSER